MKLQIDQEGDIIEEIWKPVKDYQGYYEVSNFGRVRSLPRTIWNSRGNGFYQTLKGKILKPIETWMFNGFFSVELFKNGDHHKVAIHRLVYQSFYGDIPDGFEVDHIDDDSTNNYADNLQLLTKPDNVRKSFNENRTYGYKRYSYKLIDTYNNEETIFKTSGEISDLLGVTTTHIRNTALNRGTTKLIKSRYKVEPIAYISNVS